MDLPRPLPLAVHTVKAVLPAPGLLGASALGAWDPRALPSRVGSLAPSLPGHDVRVDGKGPAAQPL